MTTEYIAADFLAGMAKRTDGDILSLAVMAAAIFGSTARPYEPDDLGEAR